MVFNKFPNKVHTQARGIVARTTILVGRSLALAYLGILGSAVCQGGTVFFDQFQAGIGPAYKTIGTASLSSSPGILNVATPNVGDGLTIDFASIGINTVNCVFLYGVQFNLPVNNGDSFSVQLTGQGTVNGAPASYVFQDQATQSGNDVVSGPAAAMIDGFNKQGGTVTVTGTNIRQIAGGFERYDLIHRGQNGGVIQCEYVDNSGNIKIFKELDPTTIFFDTIETYSIIKTAGTSSGFSLTEVSAQDVHVPEPCSLTLGGIALLALLVYSGFRR
jgi:hypothetical protein